MSDGVAPPNIEQKKAEGAGKKWLKLMLRHRRTFIIALQFLKWFVAIMRVLRDMFSSP